MEGFIGGDLWIEKFTTFDVWENAGPVESGDKLHLKSVPAGRALRVGNSLELDTDVDDAGGLEGQIILNARNLDTNTDRWTAVTRVRDTSNQYVTLQVANSASNQYPDETSKLGGGAIGVVPFELHDQDCVPVHASLVCSVPTLEANEDRETVILRHYGPIFDSKPSDEYKPLKIERKSNV